MPRIFASSIFCGIASRRLRKRLRTTDAISYAPSVFYVPLNADTAHLVLYAASEKMDAEEASVKENESRAKSLLETIVAKLLLVEASPAGTDLDEQPKTTLTASLDELAERLPGVRFPDALKLPRLRKRLFYPDDKLARLAEIFEKVNKERLGGRY